MTGSPKARIVLVGHCSADSHVLKNVIGRVVPGADVIRVNDSAALEPELAGADLLLINRIPEGEFDPPDGVGLIRALGTREGVRATRMLISNYPGAQHEAERAGAVPGFGKARAGSAEAAERLRAALASASREDDSRGS